VYGSPTTRTVSLALTLVSTLAVAIVLGVLAGTGPASAQQARDVGEPDVAAMAWVLTDLRSGDFLARKTLPESYP
jgi:D-alanyl-D-alanine carboxypeptidase